HWAGSATTQTQEHRPADGLGQSGARPPPDRPQRTAVSSQSPAGARAQRAGLRRGVAGLCRRAGLRDRRAGPPLGGSGARLAVPDRSPALALSTDEGGRTARALLLPTPL